MEGFDREQITCLCAYVTVTCRCLKTLRRLKSVEDVGSTVVSEVDDKRQGGAVVGQLFVAHLSKD